MQTGNKVTFRPLGHRPAAPIHTVHSSFFSRSKRILQPRRCVLVAKRLHPLLAEAHRSLDALGLCVTGPRFFSSASNRRATNASGLGIPIAPPPILNLLQLAATSTLGPTGVCASSDELQIPRSSGDHGETCLPRELLHRSTVRPSVPGDALKSIRLDRNFPSARPCSSAASDVGNSPSVWGFSTGLVTSRSDHSLSTSRGKTATSHWKHSGKAESRATITRTQKRSASTTSSSYESESRLTIAAG